MLSYQAEALTQLADRLDRRARVVPWVCAGVGVAVGVGAGMFVTVFLAPGGGLVYPLGMAAVVGYVAYFLAHAQALALQLEAQTALCQRKIEENTRTR